MKQALDCFGKPLHKGDKVERYGDRRTGEIDQIGNRGAWVRWLARWEVEYLPYSNIMLVAAAGAGSR